MTNKTLRLRAAILSSILGIGLATAAHAQATRPVVTTPASIAKAQADSARYPYTAADIEFVSGMIHHHAQAIAMSDLAPKNESGPAVRKLAARIINAQQDEIHLMQTWLADRRQPVPEASATGMKMVMHGMEHTMLMPGMLSEEQMKELGAARGAGFDKLFLKYMIQHHRGATAMVAKLFDTYGAGQDAMIFKLASDVNIDQTTEITRMYQLLSLIEIGINP